MEAWIIWIIIAIVLTSIEVITQMVWTICMAVGCIGGMIASLCGAECSTQIIIMAATSIVAFIILMPLFKRWHETHRHRINHNDRTGMDALLGRKATVTQTIMPGAMGRARIDGDNWQVQAPEAITPIPPGAEVIVTAYSGNILTVNP